MLFLFVSCSSDGNIEQFTLPQRMTHQLIAGNKEILKTLYIHPIYEKEIIPLNDLTGFASEKKAENEDVVGWLTVDGTTINDPVLHRDDDVDFYYLRRDFYGNYSFDGSYFTATGCQFDGGREGLSLNTIIYGHSYSDDSNGTLFSQLKKYNDTNYALENPYLYFSTTDENMAWEVFAVYTTNTNLYYYNPNPNEEQMTTVLEGARSRSIYNYEVDVTPEDYVLTLSTCVYQANGSKLSYPNDYRYVIMAKLIDPTEPLKENATFEVNPSPAAA